MNYSHDPMVAHYERCFEEHGDTHLGVNWPNEADAQKRYRVMLDIRGLDMHAPDTAPVRLLDYGCGLGHLLDYIIKERMVQQFQYRGYDPSKALIDACRKKNDPGFFSDVRMPDLKFHYIVLNGLFTERIGLTKRGAMERMRSILREVWQQAERGIAFNVMSAHVDWNRKDLFHLQERVLIEFVTEELTRNFIIRNDYGLYEYTTYLYKQPI